jgi:hypothetical protein
MLSQLKPVFCRDGNGLVTFTTGSFALLWLTGMMPEIVKEREQQKNIEQGAFCQATGRRV